MDVPLRVGFLVAALSTIGVASDGHAPSKCQRELARCTSDYDSKRHDKDSLRAYYDCLTPVVCSGRDAIVHEEMMEQVAWSLNNYNEYDYDKVSSSSQLHNLSRLLIASWVALTAWAAGKFFLPVPDSI